MTTNGQSPFVTLFLYLDKDDEYLEENAQIITEILRQRYEGSRTKRAYTSHPHSPSSCMCSTRSIASKAASTTMLPSLPVKCSSKAPVSRLYLREKDARNLRRQRVQPDGLPAPSFPRGKTKTAIINSRGVSIRASFPSTCRRSASLPRATRRSSGNCSMKGSISAARRSCAATARCSAPSPTFRPSIGSTARSLASKRANPSTNCCLTAIPRCRSDISDCTRSPS